MTVVARLLSPKRGCVFEGRDRVYPIDSTNVQKKNKKTMSHAKLAPLSVDFVTSEVIPEELVEIEVITHYNSYSRRNAGGVYYSAIRRRIFLLKVPQS